MDPIPIPPPPPRHILIDFENVPATDLAPIAGLAVEVTFLVGEKNKRLDIDLVAQMLSAGSRMHLVRVGASGPNALDLTLAYYLGRAAAENPRAEFFIVSKDTDYDAMIAHANRHGARVSRHVSVGELPFLAPKKQVAPARPAELFLQFLAHSRDHPGNRPKRRATLLTHIRTHFGNKVSEAEAVSIVAKLEKGGHVTIDDKDRVGYVLE